MKWLAILALVASTAIAQAQTLRIGLAEDPDMLDPTLARTFVGRIVFAGLCDKLFDLDEKLNIVPQLATGYEWSDPKTLVFGLDEFTGPGWQSWWGMMKTPFVNPTPATGQPSCEEPEPSRDRDLSHV